MKSIDKSMDDETVYFYILDNEAGIRSCSGDLVGRDAYRGMLIQELCFDTKEKHPNNPMCWYVGRCNDCPQEYDGFCNSGFSTTPDEQVTRYEKRNKELLELLNDA